MDVLVSKYIPVPQKYEMEQPEEDEAQIDLLQPGEAAASSAQQAQSERITTPYMTK